MGLQKIELITEINAPIERCFDLARDVDFHKLSTEKTKEITIAGRMHGLCELGDTVTWEANHLRVRQQLSIVITKFEKPYFFEDKMTKGAFKSMRHEHFFERIDKITRMTDYFHYQVPYGILGSFFDKIILRKYMTDFLLKRNSKLKSIAEGNL
ncbi:SRPBCC family protein [Algoriphagus winogradskyi]|uniref:Ligand-binding SRPBCC domain-containing protein n=1 Tax=Algoriphagus winogradskyi TaxID=237017 RepID=A0ABY1NKW2_9BACT|nr:SRPBCC family protein [Algoriphagus winogradskyi]SMP12397.1 Ligand-binding SRPBCC domain-containing protein [Algoriphagus winogradskyi]